ncbi:MAG: isoprenylcysteine carboxylmethyltransferase family protein [bacterium]|nr:isoprenylcysteine carboxylmethyltransferase family protein [bacterium]
MTLLLAYILFFLDNFLRELLRWKNKASRFNLASDDKKSSLLMLIYLVIVLLAPIVKVYGIGELEILILQWLGIVFVLVGIMIHIISIETLGRYYSGMLSTTEDQPLIRIGLYASIRHPGYLGNLLVGLGFGLAAGNWLSLIIILIAFCSVYLYRIHQEEKMLLAKFGNEYKKYMKETDRLVPGVY